MQAIYNYHYLNIVCKPSEACLNYSQPQTSLLEIKKKHSEYGGSEIHLVGRKKEPLILEATNYSKRRDGRARRSMCSMIVRTQGPPPGLEGGLCASVTADSRACQCLCCRLVSFTFLCAHPLKWID